MASTSHSRIRAGYDSPFNTVQFAGAADEAVFAAAAEWCGRSDPNMILRAVTYAVYDLHDENDCALTLIYEPM
ncbi:hypothetical protein [Amycolatopsis sp. MtRt-6]|uniref:hypothetical protein n=1 Tax=Amycolatopsis sp. MtRt-6 TaxID=2792782 RepID=UPI001A8C71FB|nr:hypothetical protein [Amycolatopsis sp. MtRt-6]